MMLLCFVVMLLSGCQEIATQQQMQPTQEKTEAYKLSAFSMPLQQEYVYDYLGMRFSLGKEIDEALEQGSLMMYLDAGYDQTTQELFMPDKSFCLYQKKIGQRHFIVQKK